MSANKTGVKTWLVVVLSLSVFLVSTVSSLFVFRHYFEKDDVSASPEKSQSPSQESNPNKNSNTRAPDADDDDTPFALLDMSATELDKEMSSLSQTRFSPMTVSSRISIVLPTVTAASLTITLETQPTPAVSTHTTTFCTGRLCVRAQTANLSLLICDAMKAKVSSASALPAIPLVTHGREASNLAILPRNAPPT